MLGDFSTQVVDQINEAQWRDFLVYTSQKGKHFIIFNIFSFLLCNVLLPPANSVYFVRSQLTTSEQSHKNQIKV